MKRYLNFGRSLYISLHTVVCSRNFLIAAALVFGVLFAEIAEDIITGLNQSYSAMGYGAAYKFNISLHFGYYIYAAPLTCAFAAGGNLINETEAGFYRTRLLKTGKHGYSLSFFMGSSMGGGLALMAGVALFAVACAMAYGTAGSIEDLAVMDAWMPLLKGHFSHWNYMLAIALLAFMFGTVWSGFGLAVSVYSSARYVSYLTPFIVCFCSALAVPANLQPLEMLVQINWETFSFPSLLLYNCILYAAIMIWFDSSFRRRIVHEDN